MFTHAIRRQIIALAPEALVLKSHAWPLAQRLCMLCIYSKHSAQEVVRIRYERRPPKGDPQQLACA